MDSYLQRFEIYAENEGWDPECYGTYLGSLLSVKALEVYSRLPAFDARDYDKLKEALLVQYQLTQEVYRNIFFSGSSWPQRRRRSSSRGWNIALTIGFVYLRLTTRLKVCAS